VNDLDPAAVAALARRIGLAPRELVALAGRLAPGDADAPRLHAELARLRSAPDAAKDVAALALLGSGDFAELDVQHLLALAWADDARREP
jgi:hypothetical protein